MMAGQMCTLFVDITGISRYLYHLNLNGYYLRYQRYNRHLYDTRYLVLHLATEYQVAVILLTLPSLARQAMFSFWMITNKFRSYDLFHNKIPSGL